jgi:hypothetical protein
MPPPWRPRPPRARPRPCLPSLRVRIRRFRRLLLPCVRDLASAPSMETTRRAQPSSDSATPSSDSRRRPPRVPPPDDPVPHGFSAATAVPSPPSTHLQPHSHDCPCLKTSFPATLVPRPSRHPHPSATLLPRRAIHNPIPCRPSCDHPFTTFPLPSLDGTGSSKVTTGDDLDGWRRRGRRRGHGLWEEGDHDGGAVPAVLYYDAEGHHVAQPPSRR